MAKRRSSFGQHGRGLRAGAGRIGISFIGPAELLRYSSGEGTMQRQVLHTPKVPPARVPLSQAIRAGDWIFASGQLGNDPRTGTLTEGGIAAQTRQVCEHLKAILETGGSSLANVVNVTIYMVDLAELLEMNAVFNEYFPKDPPARTTFQCVALVGGALVEIDAMAFI